MDLQSFLKFCQFVLKILSGIEILVYIKGHSSGTNVRKMTYYNPNQDIVKMNAYLKFGENLSILFVRYWAKTKFRHKSRVINHLQMCDK